MPALPLPATDEIKLADWLEICALTAPDENASVGDLERALHRGGIFQPAEWEAADRVVAAVFHELQGRVRSAGDAYPFTTEGGLVSSKGALDCFVPYVFCLCLSFFPWEQRKGSKVFPRRMFEELSCVAAKNYVGGDGVRFGAPRTSLPKAFKGAVDALCGMVGEGERCQSGHLLSSQDGGLDVVAWKHFPDGLAGKLLLLGQCASGWNWQDKTSELQPESFCKTWLARSPASPLIKAFFIPHRVRGESWNWLTYNGGIVFDRCRLAYWAQQAETYPKGELSHWARRTLETAV